MTNVDQPAPDRTSSKPPPTVREAFERWARWREQARYYGGSGAASGGQYQDGRGTRVCPTCKGKKRMPGHLVGSKQEYLPVPCPQCEGAGKVAGDLGVTRRTRVIDCDYCRDEKTGTSRGELPDGRTCHKCTNGKRVKVDLLVHPATIKSTRHLGPFVDPDTVSVKINATVLDWLQHNSTYWLARVVIEEYCRNGTQVTKAKRIGVSQGWFSKNLKEAHGRMETVIREAGKKGA